MPSSHTCGGSSPLTRGKLDGLGDHGLDRGLIPAHAGKTGRIAPDTVRLGAHPRSRGENACGRGTAPSLVNSSPLTRGKRITPHRIPTHRVAHPRSRGENVQVAVDNAGAAGSSPLTRGKQSELEDEYEAYRLIPAHAGKTTRRISSPIRCGAHPRSRGENWACRWTSTRPRGSSPLTRGKPSDRSSAWRRMGLIPAHAGKTPRTRRACSASGAHPRSRGENIMDMRVSRRPLGSSPLTRGKPATASSSL